MQLLFFVLWTQIDSHRKELKKKVNTYVERIAIGHTLFTQCIRINAKIEIKFLLLQVSEYRYLAFKTQLLLSLCRIWKTLPSLLESFSIIFCLFLSRSLENFIRPRSEGLKAPKYHHFHLRRSKWPILPYSLPSMKVCNRLYQSRKPLTKLKAKCACWIFQQSKLKQFLSSSCQHHGSQRNVRLKKGLLHFLCTNKILFVHSKNGLYCTVCIYIFSRYHFIPVSLLSIPKNLLTNSTKIIMFI